ncbi:hypothetical protein WJX75_008355 [Coccomyxa subellipsoidea]|uniref:Uncharacterized protein n=1 Tax=Coccomyxa subellipsoidea TaxID=248742 RepID=A0ABR2YLS8_9CHLO
MDSSRHPHIDEDTLENRILPAIARHMAEIQQQQPKEASNILQPKLASGQISASPSDLLKTREQVEAVVMNLEDELAVLDLRYAELLRRQQHHRQGGHHNSSTNELKLEEEAHAAAKVREAMQRKGQQIQQLRQYTALLKS